MGENTIPKLDNCGTYWARANGGQWHYLNHAGTWQGFQGPYAAKDAEIEALKKVLETIRAICRGASAAGTPEMGLQTVIDCVNIAIDPGVV